MPDFLSIAGLDVRILFIGDDGVVAYANGAMCAALGRAREDIVGRPLSAIDRLPIGEGVLARLSEEARRKNQVVSIDTGFVDPESGETQHARITAQPIREGVQIVIEDRSEHRRLEQAFQRYVGPKVLERMLQSGRDFDIPDRREISILFVDLRGFTAMAQSLPPDDVRTTINAYLDEAIRRVYAHDGMVDKIVGDEVMALFGAPLPTRDHALRALRCAVDIIESHRAVAAAFERRGLKMPACGVGVETGEAVVGNIGSALQQDYTAIGASVNMAARLCVSARSWHVLTTEHVLRRAAEQAADLGEEWAPAPLEPQALDDPSRSVAGQVVAATASPRRGERFRAAGMHFTYLDLIRVKGVDAPIQAVDVRAAPEFREAMATARDGAVSDGAGAAQGIRTFAEYDLLEELGRGGMGVVYKARHRILGRVVALKMMMAGPEAGASQVARFDREARAIASLQHPHVIRVYEVGQSDGYHFFTMEYVDGAPLDRLISAAGGVSGSKSRVESRIEDAVSFVADSMAEVRKSKTESPGPATQADVPAPPADVIPRIALTVNQRVEFMRKILEALAYAHGRGVIHRDIKPGNVMVSRSGEPILMDFGLAHARGEGFETLTRIGAVVGTTAYMAPEQALGRMDDVDERSDVYSAGAVLYELLTGRRPFEPTGNPARDLAAIIQDEPSPPRKVDAAVPEELDLIVRKAMEKDARRRYVTAAAFAEDLGRYLRNEPILARPPSLAYALRKHVARYPGIWATAMAALVILAAVAVGAFVRITAERADALAARDAAVSAQSETAAALEVARQREAEALAERARASYAESTALQARDRAEVSAQEATSRAHIVQGTTYLRAGRLREAYREITVAYEASPSVEAEALLGQIVNLRWPLLLRVDAGAPVMAGRILKGAKRRGKILLASAGGRVALHDEQGGKLASRELGGAPTALAEYWDGEFLAVAFADNSVAILRGADLAPVGRIADAGRYVEFGPEGLLAAMSARGDRLQVKIFRLPQLTEVSRSPEYVWGRTLPRMSFSNDGRLLIGVNGMPVWHKERDWELLPDLEGHGAYNYVTQVHGSMVVNWSTAQTGERGALLLNHLPVPDDTPSLSIGALMLDNGRIRDINSIAVGERLKDGAVIGLVGGDGAEIWAITGNEGSVQAWTYNASLLPQEEGDVMPLHLELSSAEYLVAAGGAAHLFAVPIRVKGDLQIAGVSGAGHWPPVGEMPFATIPQVMYTLAMTADAVYGWPGWYYISRYGFSDESVDLFHLPPAEASGLNSWYTASGNGFAVTPDGRIAARLMTDRVAFFDLTRTEGRVTSSVNRGRRIRVWEMRDDAVLGAVRTQENAFTLTGETRPYVFELSPDGRRALIIDAQAGVEAVSRETGKARRFPLVPLSGTGSAADLRSNTTGVAKKLTYATASSGDWRFVAIGRYPTDSSGIMVWRVDDLFKGNTEPFFTTPPRRAVKIAFHPKKPLMYAGIEGSGIEVWDLKARRCVAVIPEGVAAAAVSQDGSMLLASRGAGRTVAFDILSSDGRTLLRAPWPDAHILNRGGFSPDGRHVIITPNQGWTAILRFRTPDEARAALDRQAVRTN